MFLEEPSPFGSVLQIEVSRRPNPVVHFVAGADFTQLAIHHFARQRHVWTFSVVMKRNALDAVGAEQSQLTDVFLKLLIIPAVIRIRCFSITQLMTANGLSGSSRYVQVRRN